MSRLARILDVTLPILASLVLVITWVYVALLLFTDSTLPVDTWAWLQGLDIVPAVVVWIALLPLGVFLWAWYAELEPIWLGLVMALLMGWTFIAWSGSARALVRLRRRR